MYVVVSRTYGCRTVSFESLDRATNVFYVWLSSYMDPVIRDHQGNVFLAVERG